MGNRQRARWIVAATGCFLALSLLPHCLDLDLGAGGGWFTFGDAGPWVHIGPIPPCIPVVPGPRSLGVECDAGQAYLCVAATAAEDAGEPPLPAACGGPFTLPAPHAEAGYVGYCCAAGSGGGD